MILDKKTASSPHRQVVHNKLAQDTEFSGTDDLQVIQRILLFYTQIDAGAGDGLAQRKDVQKAFQSATDSVVGRNGYHNEMGWVAARWDDTVMDSPGKPASVEAGVSYKSVGPCRVQTS